VRIILITIATKAQRKNMSFKTLSEREDSIAQKIVDSAIKNGKKNYSLILILVS